MTPTESAKGKLSLSYIREKTEKFYWKTFLSNYIQSLPYNKIDSEVRFGKIPTGYKDLLQLKPFIDILRNHSSIRVEHSYQFKEDDVSPRASEEQTIPKKIFFETEENLLHFLKKTKQANLAKENYKKILTQLPELQHWILSHLEDALIAIEENEKSNWDDMIKVCRYFLDSHIPNKYFLRELKIQVHSKFIEDNKSYLKKILNEVLPKEKINEDEKNDFELRFKCLVPDDTIRLKFLDPDLKTKFKIPLIDFSIPLSEFILLNFQDCNILFLENKTNFYLLQGEFYFKNTVAIFGSGYGILQYKEKREDKTNKPIDWILNNPVYYWGDMDSAGFEILHKFKYTYPHTIPIFMDKQTYTTFEIFAHSLDSKTKEIPKLPLEDDCDLYSFLKQNNLRLEQERITHEYIKTGLAKIFLSSK